MKINIVSNGFGMDLAATLALIRSRLEKGEIVFAKKEAKPAKKGFRRGGQKKFVADENMQERIHAAFQTFLVNHVARRYRIEYLFASIGQMIQGYTDNHQKNILHYLVNNGCILEDKMLIIKSDVSCEWL